MSDLVRLRASSLPELFDCPARWEAKHVKNMRLPTSAAAQLGTAVHAGTAVFDMARIVGEDVSAEDSAENVVKAIWHPETDVDWSDTPQKEAEPIALALHRKYCDEISPKFTFADVEAECESLDIPELGISLTGTTDRIFSTALGEYGIADLKTGKSAVSTDGTVKTAGHAAQIAVYELLAEVATQKEITAPAKIVGLQVAKTDAGRRVAVGEIKDAKQLLIGTEEEPGLLEIASAFIKSGVFYGNPRSQLCNPKYCPAYPICKFRR